MIKILAVICSIAGNCHEVQVTSTDYQEMSMSDCFNIAALAKWMSENHPNDRLASWKCVLGKHEERGA
jgi:hypothetical protein